MRNRIQEIKESAKSREENATSFINKHSIIEESSVVKSETDPYKDIPQREVVYKDEIAKLIHDNFPEILKGLLEFTASSGVGASNIVAKLKNCGGTASGMWEGVTESSGAGEFSGNIWLRGRYIENVLGTGAIMPGGKYLAVDIRNGNHNWTDELPASDSSLYDFFEYYDIADYVKGVGYVQNGHTCGDIHILID